MERVEGSSPFQLLRFQDIQTFEQTPIKHGPVYNLAGGSESRGVAFSFSAYSNTSWHDFHVSYFISVLEESAMANLFSE